MQIFVNVAAKYLECHLNIHRLHDNNQSTYCTGHRDIAALALLDFSTTFDVTDCEVTFGMTGSAYLKDRTRRVLGPNEYY